MSQLTTQNLQNAFSTTNMNAQALQGSISPSVDVQTYMLNDTFACDLLGATSIVGVVWWLLTFFVWPRVPTQTQEYIPIYHVFYWDEASGRALFQTWQTTAYFITWLFHIPFQTVEMIAWFYRNTVPTFMITWVQVVFWATLCAGWMPGLAASFYVWIEKSYDWYYIAWSPEMFLMFCNTVFWLASLEFHYHYSQRCLQHQQAKINSIASGATTTCDYTQCVSNCVAPSTVDAVTRQNYEATCKAQCAAMCSSQNSTSSTSINTGSSTMSYTCNLSRNVGETEQSWYLRCLQAQIAATQSTSSGSANVNTNAGWGTQDAFSDFL